MNQTAEIKVFRLNDHDWVAAESFEKARDWYMKETGLPEDEALDPSHEPYEVSVEKGWMWYPVDHLSEKEQQTTMEMKEIEGILMAKVPFKRVVELENRGKPWIIASAD